MVEYEAISVEEEWLSTLIYSAELYQELLRLQILKKTLAIPSRWDGCREGPRGRPRKALQMK